MKVFIVGIGNGVGRRVGEQLAAAGDEPDGLVRQQRQVEALASVGINAARRRDRDVDRRPS